MYPPGAAPSEDDRCGVRLFPLSSFTRADPFLAEVPSPLVFSDVFFFGWEDTTIHPPFRQGGTLRQRGVLSPLHGLASPSGTPSTVFDAFVNRPQSKFLDLPPLAGHLSIMPEAFFPPPIDPLRGRFFWPAFQQDGVLFPLIATVAIWWWH